MIPVKIADISLSNLGFVILLQTVEGEKTLPIFIGVPEAQAIAVQFNKLKTPRPLTHDLLKNILTLLDCAISKVVVDDLVDNTFYAKIYLENKQEQFQLDSRPSDAIALALRFEIPIYVEEKVLEQGSIQVKQESEKRQVSTVEVLQDRLKDAVDSERYEEAAKIRDEINRLGGSN